MKNSFKVSYVTTLPKEANVPRVTITGDEDKEYFVKFWDLNNKWGELSKGFCKNNQTIICGVKQIFTRWLVQIFDEDRLVYEDLFDPTGKTIFIKMDAYALGDSIAWIPYVEIFRQKYKCNVICSTFHNHLFVQAFPDIMFVKPNTVIDNVYAQYYIGAVSDGNKKYSNVLIDKVPLQAAAYETLGLEPMEVRPDLRAKFIYEKPNIEGKYVTISEHASNPIKGWRVEGGWQKVVDYINSKGYKVLAISKEPTTLQNVIDLTGDSPLDKRAVDLMHAKFHIGVSSGLSWLAWALGTHVVMVSDGTPKFHEFSSNITRLGGENLSQINYETDTQTSVEKVLEKLGELLV